MPTKRIVHKLLLYTLVSAVALSLAASASADVRVLIAGGYEEITSFSKDDKEYISLSGLVSVLGGSIDWATVGHSVDYAQDNYRFRLLFDSPFFKLNDTLYNMTYPVVYREGQVFVPATTFLPFLDRVNNRKITWDPDAKRIRLDSEYFNVTDIAFAPKANGMLIEIYLTTALPYEIFVTEGNWVNVSIRNGKLNKARLESREERRYMYDLKAHQISSSTGQVSFRLKRKVEKWHHKLVQDPPRIQISIADVDFEYAEEDDKPPIGPDEKIDVIVIDAGHGGKDYGAIGQRGTREKDIVLDIAKRLAKIIRKDKQFKVVMTRDRDKTVSLPERARIANQAKADLFISIHANASPKRQARGWNVFFLAPAKNDSARAVEQLENSFYLREYDAYTAHSTPVPDVAEDPVLSILNEMIMTEFQAESHDFAMMIDLEFRRRLKTPARGVDQAGFVVLNKVFTPSVLVESAFISNKHEEQLLRTDDYQEDIAEGIYRAIKRFKAKYEER